MENSSDTPPENKPSVTLPGTVEKIIPSNFASEPEKAEIAVDGAEPLYQEIRIENKLQDNDGNEVELKPGAEVEVTIKADPSATTPKIPVQSDRTSQESGAEPGKGQKR
jgi:hypothetical protein